MPGEPQLCIRSSGAAAVPPQSPPPVLLLDCIISHAVVLSGQALKLLTLDLGQSVAPVTASLLDKPILLDGSYFFMSSFVVSDAPLK